MEAQDILCPVLLIGHQKVGKSSIIKRYTLNRFDQSKLIPTEGVNFYVKTINIKDSIIKLQIYDTSTYKPFSAINQNQFKKARILVFVFDLTNLNSFLHLQKLLFEFQEQKIINQQCTGILVGTKCDKVGNRKVPHDKASQLGKIIGQYIKVSSLTGQNIDKLFYDAVQFKLNGDIKSITSHQMFLAQILNKNIGYFENSQLHKYQIEGQRNMENKFQEEYAAPTYSIHIEQKQSQLNFQNTIQEPKFTPVKIILIGDTKVGKTSIIQNYVNKQFRQNYKCTYAIDLSTKTIQLDGVTFKVQIWDTPGLQKYQGLDKSYLKDTDIIIVVYDITEQQSFYRARCQLKTIRQLCGNKLKYICLVGNKKDLQDRRCIQTEIGMKLAQQQKVDFLEIQAWNYSNLQVLFNRSLKHFNQHTNKNS